MAESASSWSHPLRNRGLRHSSKALEIGTYAIGHPLLNVRGGDLGKWPDDRCLMLSS